MNHWLNAMNAAQKSINDKTRYKESVLEILGMEGEKAYGNSAVASDNNVVLVSALFNDATQKWKKRPFQASRTAFNYANI